jgi:hypothetical protein
MGNMDAILAKKDKRAYTALQSDVQLRVDDDTAFRDNLGTLPAIFARMIQADNPLLVGFSNQQLGVQFLPLLQHNGINSVPLGYTTTNPNNEIKRDANKPGESEGQKLV